MQEATPIPPRHPPGPHYSGGEYRADAIMHLLGVTAGWLGGVWLVLTSAGVVSTAAVLALAVYAIAMSAMLSVSAAYNLARRPSVREWLRRLDHSCIYAAIAGTYTPLLLRLPERGAMPSLILVWALAVAGTALKLLAPRRHERLGLALYVSLGWIGLPLIPALSGRLRADTGIWIGAGALIYTIGIGAYLAEQVRYHNVIWHFMVLVAAACHYKAMWGEFGP